MVWYSHLFKNFPQFVFISTMKGFGIVNTTEIDVFMEFSCFFYDPLDVDNLISGSSAFPKSSLNIWNFLVHVLLKTSLENFGYYFASIWDEHNCVVAWTIFGIALLWNRDENWPFPVCYKLVYSLTSSLASLELSLRTNWGAVSWAVVLILLQIKNLTCNSQIGHTF